MTFNFAILTETTRVVTLDLMMAAPTRRAMATAATVRVAFLALEAIEMEEVA